MSEFFRVAFLKCEYFVSEDDSLTKCDTTLIIYNTGAGFEWSKNIIDLQGKQNYSAKRTNCPQRCIILYARGNIYYCYVHAYIKSFIEYFNVDIPITKNDYIKIADIKDIKEIYDFLNKPKPLCRFCKQCHNT